MSNQTHKISSCGTHHINNNCSPAYKMRFDEVLKFHPPGLAGVSSGGQGWHITTQGEPAYTRRFNRVFGFYDGIASVKDTDGWHHISANGCDIYQSRYLWCGNFQHGRCTVRSADGAYHHIGIDGEEIYESRWRYAGDYRDGIAAVQSENGSSTHIGINGEFIHNRWFLDLDVFHKGYARACDDEGWMHVDLKGNPLYRKRFKNVEPFYNGQARVENYDGSLHIINETGEMIIELRAPQNSEFVELSADMVGFWRTQTISAAVQVGVFEELPCNSIHIASNRGLHADRTRRLLNALQELGLVEYKEDVWSSTSKGQYLQADHPLTLADAALEYAGDFSEKWKLLPDALELDNSNWQASDVFQEVADNHDRCAGHHRMLESYAQHDYKRIAEALPLDDVGHIIDAAGGLGVIGDLINAKFPSVKVSILERPEVVDLAQQSNKENHWVARDIFKPWKLKADAVVLARVLHDWDDENAIHILKQARSTLPIGGKLFIIEMLLDEKTVAGSLCDLHLLMVTGGRERTYLQFNQLANAAGFRIYEIRHLPTLPSILIGQAV